VNLKKCSVKKFGVLCPIITLIIFLSFIPNSLPSIKRNYFNTPLSEEKELINLLLNKRKDSDNLKKIKNLSFRMSGASVPILIKAMKSNKFPDKNRWAATFILGKIMGKKSVPLLIKYLEHPNFILRLASLKTLLQLKERNLKGNLKKVLRDKSLLVRIQALENIKRLKLKKYSNDVWKMLFEKKNYHNLKNKKFVRGRIIRKVVRVLGDLNFKRALGPFLKLIQKDHYQDLFFDIDYSLQKLSGKKSPDGSEKLKRFFWKKYMKKLSM
tara:strand:+ start:14020 stop:14826 length:807 start_codon:yes stop_codon:yes gene_type:complete